MADMEGDETLDLTRARRIAEALYGETGRAWAYLRRMAEWTDEAASDPRLWRVIAALAERLVIAKTLGRDRAWAIMETAWGDSDSLPILEMGRKWRRRFLCKRMG